MRMRALNRLYARAGGFFWLPCPLCGQHFGGHEWDGTAIALGGWQSKGICGDCSLRLGAEPDPIFGGGGYDPDWARGVVRS